MRNVGAGSSLEPAHVRPLENRDTRVVAELRVELAAQPTSSAVTRRPGGGSRRSPSRGADVETVLARDVDPRRPRARARASRRRGRRTARPRRARARFPRRPARRPSHAPSRARPGRAPAPASGSRRARSTSSTSRRFFELTARAYPVNPPANCHECGRSSAAARSRSLSRAPRGRAAAPARPRSARGGPSRASVTSSSRNSRETVTPSRSPSTAASSWPTARFSPRTPCRSARAIPGEDELAVSLDLGVA